jgi:hypothetical protein
MTAELMQRLNSVGDKEFDRLFRKIEIPLHPEAFSESHFRFEVRQLFTGAIHWALAVGAEATNRGLASAELSDEERRELFE